MLKLTEIQRERVLLLTGEHGELTPRTIVEDARNVESPLHELFQWDDKVAAEQQRLHTARTVIRSVVITVTTTNATIRAPLYVRDPDAAPAQGYRSVEALRQDEAVARQALITELNRAAGTLMRAQRVAAALNLVDELEILTQRIVGLRQGLETPEESPAPPPS